MSLDLLTIKLLLEIKDLNIKYENDTISLFELSKLLNKPFSNLFRVFSNLKFNIENNKNISRKELESFLNFVLVVIENRNKFTKDLSELPVQVKLELLRIKDDVNVD